MVKKIACYITGGWTECGAMQSFLTKINSGFSYWQRCPNKPKGKKGLSPVLSGLTGTNLLEYMYRDLEKYSGEIKQCYAILLEDDLDGNFHNYSSEDIKEYYKRIQERVNKILGKEIPIFILYASPEIEAWFISDWENTFGSVYKREYGGTLTAPENKYFSYRLLQYIKTDILKQYAVNIEE
jgi:hypothetical protein